MLGRTTFLIGVSQFYLLIVSSKVRSSDSYIYSCHLRLTLTFHVENFIYANFEWCCATLQWVRARHRTNSLSLLA